MRNSYTIITKCDDNAIYPTNRCTIRTLYVSYVESGGSNTFMFHESIL